MIIGSCKDCKYWLFVQWSRHYGKHSECSRFSGAGEPEKDLADAEANVFAYADDDSGLLAGLQTGPLFGCIAFEPADDEEESE